MIKQLDIFQLVLNKCMINTHCFSSKGIFSGLNTVLENGTQFIPSGGVGNGTQSAVSSVFPILSSVFPIRNVLYFVVFAQYLQDIIILCQYFILNRSLIQYAYIQLQKSVFIDYISSLQVVDAYKKTHDSVASIADGYASILQENETETVSTPSLTMSIEKSANRNGSMRVGGASVAIDDGALEDGCHAYKVIVLIWVNCIWIYVKYHYSVDSTYSM